jgi:hypothetical protein
MSYATRPIDSMLALVSQLGSYTRRIADAQRIKVETGVITTEMGAAAGDRGPQPKVKCAHSHCHPCIDTRNVKSDQLLSVLG